MTDAQYAAGLHAYWHAPTEAEGWTLLCESGFPVSPMPLTAEKYEQTYWWREVDGV